LYFYSRIEYSDEKKGFVIVKKLYYKNVKNLKTIIKEF